MRCGRAGDEKGIAVANQVVFVEVFELEVRVVPVIVNFFDVHFDVVLRLIVHVVGGSNFGQAPPDVLGRALLELFEESEPGQTQFDQVTGHFGEADETEIQGSDVVFFVERTKEYFVQHLASRVVVVEAFAQNNQRHDVRSCRSCQLSDLDGSFLAPLLDALEEVLDLLVHEGFKGRPTKADGLESLHRVPLGHSPLFVVVHQESRVDEGIHQCVLRSGLENIFDEVLLDQVGIGRSDQGQCG